MSLPDPSIFRAYDIRGKVGQTLTSEVVELVGRAFGTFIKNKGGRTISLSQDKRESSNRLAKNFVRGVLATGTDVLDLGLATTPMLYFSIIKHNLDGGAIITGSHNVPNYNGIKLCQKKALHVFGSELKEIQKIIADRAFSSGQGSLTKKDIFPEYETEILSRVRLKRSLRISLNCGKGSTEPFAPEIFKRLGCKIVDKDGAEVGISFDPDGDRLSIADEKEEPVLIEAVAALIAKDILQRKKGARFVYDVKSLTGFKKMVEKYGGRTEMLPTGRSYFRQKLFEDPAVALGVEASGHVHLNDNYYGFDDGILAAARFLEIVAAKHRPVSSLVGEFPQSFYTPTIEPFCPDEKKFSVVESLRLEFRENYDTIEIDGVRINFDADSWALIRASNTGPRLTLRFESNDRNKLLKMVEIVAEELREYPEVDNSWVEQAKQNVHNH